MKVFVALIILSMATPAVAQRSLIISDRAIAGGLEKMPPAPPPQSRDSLANGAIIGALVGGVAMAASGGWVCTMLKEPGDPPCWKSVLPVSAIAAAIGAGVGAGIDALAMRSPRLPGPPERAPQSLRRERN